jgi:FkbM family methyltransferase
VAGIVSNQRSFSVLRKLLRAGPEALGAPREGVQLRALEGRTIWLRPGTSDAIVVWETFVGRFHRPPAALAADVPVLILDLGANIGLTMADMAVRYPQARIVGIELDAANAALARANLQPWSDRCELLEGAVCSEDGVARYEGEAGNEYGFRVVGAGAGAARSATAFSLNTILARVGGAADYVKMDIEGAERDVLRANTAWAQHVRMVKVEAHAPYAVSECISDLQLLGFSVRRDRSHEACAVGIRSRL